jgi:hypothetical protein
VTTRTIQIDKESQNILNKLSKKLKSNESELIKLAEKFRSNLESMIDINVAIRMLAVNNGLDVSINKLDKESDIRSIESLGMDNDLVTIVGRVSRLYPLRIFQKKDEETKLQVLELHDGTGFVEVKLWGHQAASFIKQDITMQQIIKISNLKQKAIDEDSVGLVSTSQTKIKSNKLTMYKYIPENNYSEDINISDVKKDMKRINITGKIAKKDLIRKFNRKDNSKEGVVASLIIQDQTASIRVTFWTEQIEQFEAIKENDVVKLIDVESHFDEYRKTVGLTFKQFSTFEKLSDKQSLDIKTEYDDISDFTLIKDIKESNQADIHVLVRITRIGEKREITFRDKNKNKSRDNGDNLSIKVVQSIDVMDNTGYFRINIWGNVDVLGELKENDIVKITHCNAKYSKNSKYSKSLELNSTVKSRIDVIAEDVNHNDGSTNNVDSDNTARNELNHNIKALFTTFDELEQMRYPFNVHIKLKVIKIGEERIIEKKSKSLLKIQVIDENGVLGELIAWDENIKEIEILDKDDLIELKNVKYEKSEYGRILTYQSNNSSFNKIDDFNYVTQPSDYSITIEVDEIDEYKSTKQDFWIKGRIFEVFPQIMSYYTCGLCRKIVAYGQDSQECDHPENVIEEHVSIFVIIKDFKRKESSNQIKSILLHIFGNQVPNFIEPYSIEYLKELKLREAQTFFRENYNDKPIKCKVRIMNSDRKILEVYVKQMEPIDD